MPLGRDIGKFKRDGYMRGKQAMRWRNAFVFGSLGLSAVFYGAVLYYTANSEEPHKFIKLIKEADQELINRREREENIRLARKQIEEEIRKAREEKKILQESIKKSQEAIEKAEKKSSYAS